MNNTIAVLLTCHNRKETTLKCLKRFFEAEIPVSIKNTDVFLVDDGSTDGTSMAVKENFPNVNVIQGTGSLFWNQGMRLAWNTARKEDEYDFYFWLNDDVILDENALNELLECYYEVLNTLKQSAIIIGACRDSKLENKFSYGGRTELKEVIPNGNLQECKYINGNIVLVPKEVYKKLGNLSQDYTHAIGDFDYGLRAIEAGFKNYTTKKYIGICPRNNEPQWSNPKIKLKKRLKLFKSPQGLNFKEYIIFRRKFWGRKWIIFAVKAYIKVLFPSMYNSMKR